MNLVLNKTTGRIHDVPDNHWSLNPAEWPRGQDVINGQMRETFSEEFEVLNPDDYVRDEVKGWVPKKKPNPRRVRGHGPLAPRTRKRPPGNPRAPNGPWFPRAVR